MNQKAFKKWIFESFDVNEQGLALSRIFSALFILFFLVPGSGISHFAYLSEVPPDFFDPPPGPMLLLDQFPPLVVFQTVHTLIVIAAIAMLFGYYTKWASIITGVSILLLQGFIFSLGKVNHEILIAVVPVIMGFSNWGAAYSVDAMRGLADSKTESWPLTLLALIIGFMMFTAGFPKILGGWLDPSTQAVQGHLLNQFYVRERDAFLAGYFAVFDNVVFWELLDWATIIFEVGFLVAVLKAKWFKLFVCLAVVFHFSTMMMLNIAFLPNFLAYALFLPWNRIYEGIRKFYIRRSGIKGQKSHHRTVQYYALILLISFSVIKWLSDKDLVLQQSDLTLHESVFLIFALFVVMWLGIKQLRQIKKVT